jgi:hypothetical protein
MIKIYEYKLIQGVEANIETLNELGVEGWELVSTVIADCENGTQMFLRREKEIEEEFFQQLIENR